MIDFILIASFFLYITLYKTLSDIKKEEEERRSEPDNGKERKKTQLLYAATDLLSSGSTTKTLSIVLQKPLKHMSPHLLILANTWLGR